MKSLKLDHASAERVRAGRLTSSWRLFDDKDLAVDDRVVLIDKVDPREHNSWAAFGEAVIDQVIQKRLADIGKHDFTAHETYQSPDLMLAQLRRHYGPSVSLKTPVKIIHFSFLPYQQQPQVIPNQRVEASQPAAAVKLYADGGSRGNPGPSASGFVLFDQANKVLVDKGVFLGITTNNQAEYTALKLGLEEARALGAQQVEVFMDSMLVVNQMKGVFKVKNRDLWPIHDAIKQLAGQFAHISYTHVPRELNKAADAAVNRALDSELDKTKQ